MRHRKKFNHLGRKAAHRKAMLANMASSLILHKRIKTTQAKAKALRMYVEPLVNKAKLSVTVKTDKMDATHLRRTVFSYLKQKEAVTELFKEVAPKVVNRPGGYTRIIKLGKRMGDDAEMVYIELVDFNELLLGATEQPAKKTTRRRRSKKSETVATPKVAETAPKASAEADDLKKVEGIGPKIAETLNAAGITTFAELAKTDVEKISEIIADVRGNHVPDTWPKQAELAAEGKWDELKKWQDELNGGKEE
ncbi:MAG: 50S ribosomal protein L17 [Flavobacteriaceae bacterium]|nr:50S ribosomal protein L17 [Flavobacteriaceae bacterium]